MCKVAVIVITKYWGIVTGGGMKSRKVEVIEKVEEREQTPISSTLPSSDRQPKTATDTIT